MLSTLGSASLSRALQAVAFVVSTAASSAAWGAANCDGTSVGFTPLDDLGTATYQGYQGGLYTGGSNLIPAAHLQAGVVEASHIEPLDSLGVPAQNGRIALLSIGMCNTSQEFGAFTTQANNFSGKNPRVVLLNGAQGGQTAAIISNPNANFWTVIDQRLQMLGLSRRQVQAVWFKEANASPTGPFPQHAQTLRDQFRTIMGILRSKYPNARVCYLSSRIYAGYATTALNPEPYAYESGFAVKWLVQEQIDGSAALNFDPANGPVNSPWIAWGPYLWADGTTPRSDGLTWVCSDFSESDGTHPADGARTKVGAALLTFLAGNSTATPWFLKASSGAGGPNPGLAVSHASPNPFRTSTAVQVLVGTSRSIRVEIVAVSGRRLKTLSDGRRDPGTWSFEWDGTDSQGRPVGSGTYFMRVLSDGDLLRTQKLTLAR